MSAQPLLGGQRRHRAEPALDGPVQRAAAPAGNGPAPAAMDAVSLIDQVAPGGRDGDAALGDLLLERRQPGGIAPGGSPSPRSSRARSRSACS